MNSFTFTQAAAVTNAVQDKAAHEGSAYGGGGTNLVDLMKENVARPTHLIGPKKLGLGTTVRVSGPNGERTIKFEDFHRLPSDYSERDNTLEPGELITGLDHFAAAETSRFEDFTENVVAWSGMFHNYKNVELGYRLAKADIYTPLDVRAPDAASSSIALEIAMDEMAYAAGLDPREFRLRNYSDHD